jgi:Ca2+-binding RTX toxin-like protein
VQNVFHAVSGSGGDILVGGSTTDVIHAGDGWDFLEGGAGTDFLFGENGNDILRGGTGGDFLFGGSGDDTYLFARGDGADTVLDESTQQVGADSGTDTLAFDPGIARSDIVVWQSGNDLVVGVRDPAHPNVPLSQLTDRITLQHWFDLNGIDRVEIIRFADGTTLNLAAGQSALASYEYPVGATLSNNTVAENSPAGTAVGTVTGFDLDANAVLNNREAINALIAANTVFAEATTRRPMTPSRCFSS